MSIHSGPWLCAAGPIGLELLPLGHLDGKVLHEVKQQYVSGAEVWAVERDYLYRGSQMLAAETPQGRRHFHLDHLGTPRLITDVNRQPVAFHAYYPYGEEATAWNHDTEQMKFTGHERDFAGAGGSGDDLDYMHARYFGPLVGRFLSLDPLRGRMARPQSWNRYAYVLGNPVKYLDPWGLQEGDTSHVTAVGLTIHGEPPGDSYDFTGFDEFSWFGFLYGNGGLGSGTIGTIGTRDYGLFDVARARRFYQQKSDESESTLGIFFYDSVLDFLPESQEELGVELVLAAIPGPLDNLGLATIKGSKFFQSFANRGAFGHSVRQVGRFTEYAVSIPGRSAGSYTRWVKVVNKEGRTIRLYHDTFDRTGRFLHRGIKVPGPVRHVP